MKLWLVLSYNVLFSESNALGNSQDLPKTCAIVTTAHPKTVFSFATQVNWYVINFIVRYSYLLLYSYFDGNIYWDTCHSKILGKIRFLYLIFDATRFNIITITQILNYFDSVLI